MKSRQTNEILEGSMRDKRMVKLTMTCPRGETHLGLVVRLTKSLVIVHEFDDFAYDGIRVCPRKCIASVKATKYEDCCKSILTHCGEIRKARRMHWLDRVEAMPDLMAVLAKRRIWPGIEIRDDSDEAESLLYIGPITAAGRSEFSIYCYDADGTWETNYHLRYRDLVAVQLESRYVRIFNDYMQATQPPHPVPADPPQRRVD